MEINRRDLSTLSRVVQYPTLSDRETLLEESSADVRIVGKLILFGLGRLQAEPEGATPQHREVANMILEWRKNNEESPVVQRRRREEERHNLELHAAR